MDLYAFELMHEIEKSLEAHHARHGWLFDRRFNQWGSPFEWIDGPNHFKDKTSMGEHLSCWISSYYESFPPIESIKGAKFDDILLSIKDRLYTVYTKLAPLELVFGREKLDEYISHMANTRAQDVAFIQKYTDFFDIDHSVFMDIGPGIAASACWNSVLSSKSKTYIAAEIDAKNYQAQRSVLSILSAINSASYTDSLAIETLAGDEQVVKKLNNYTERFIQLPTWHFHGLKNNSVDIITATTVLNEINHAGIGYLIAESLRLLKVGGHLYIRDSGKVKPGRHNIEYEKFLPHLGMRRADNLCLSHKKDIHGIVRIWKKIDEVNISFDDIMVKFLSNEALVAQGPRLAQNIDTK